MSDASAPGAEPVDASNGAGRPPEGDEATGVPAAADEVLLGSRELARAALLEITPEQTVGADAGHIVEGENVLSLRFASRLDGYVGWFWTVTIARTAESAPTVLEVALLPGDGALVAPDWVPWSERLAEYRASQEAAENDGEAAESLDEDDDVDEADLAADDELDIDDLEDDSDDDDSDDEDSDEEDHDDSDDDDSDDDDSDDDDSDDDDEDDSDEDDSDDDDDDDDDHDDDDDEEDDRRHA